ncbi:unnamed protein product [Phaeothamnion confervicola]
MPSRHVFVLEDYDSDSVFFVRAIAEIDPGTTVAVYPNAESALAALREQTGSAPALFLIDLHLTGMDGLAFIKQARALPSYANSPVIVLSGDLEPGLEEKALAAGANRYYSKPVRYDDLKSLIDFCLREYAS